MEVATYEQAEPIIEELRQLNRYIPMLQAGTAVHIIAGPQFPAANAPMQALMNTFLDGVQDDYLAALQARVTTLEGQLTAISEA